MKSTIGSGFGSESQISDTTFSIVAGTAARAGVVNRTHRVVRQRAKVMQARRWRVPSAEGQRCCSTE